MRSAYLNGKGLPRDEMMGVVGRTVWAGPKPARRNEAATGARAKT